MDSGHFYMMKRKNRFSVQNSAITHQKCLPHNTSHSQKFLDEIASRFPSLSPDSQSRAVPASFCRSASVLRHFKAWPSIWINCSLCGIPVVWSDYEIIRVGKPQKPIIFFWRDWFRWLPPVCDRAAAVSSQWMKLQVQFKIPRSDSRNLSIRWFPTKTSPFCCLSESARDEKFSYSTVLFKLYDMERSIFPF